MKLSVTFLTLLTCATILLPIQKSEANWNRWRDRWKDWLDKPEKSCTLGNTNIVSGQSITAFKSDFKDSDSACVSELRTCQNGALAGQFTYLNCQNKARKISIADEIVKDEYNNPIQLHGFNLDGINDEEAFDIKNNLKKNFMRLRVSFIPDNRADTLSGFTPEFEALVDSWVQTLVKHKLWFIIEMRGSDNVTNDAAFYDTYNTTCEKPSKDACFSQYLKAWKYLSQKYKDTNYVAGFGLLAEPSTNKAFKTDPHLKLIAFQKKLMQEISVIAPESIFFIGPDWNYDTMQYRHPEYFTLLSEYKNRMIYAVNFLTPKPWIGSGQSPLGMTEKIAYPQLGTDENYETLIEGTDHENMERAYSYNLDQEDNFRKALSPNFIPWYLQWPLQFRQQFRVPLYVDQFGASTLALGQLDYEKDLIAFFEQQGLHWTRWSYNAGDPTRLVIGNPHIIKFYSEIP